MVVVDTKNICSKIKSFIGIIRLSVENTTMIIRGIDYNYNNRLSHVEITNSYNDNFDICIDSLELYNYCINVKYHAISMSLSEAKFILYDRSITKELYIHNNNKYANNMNLHARCFRNDLFNAIKNDYCSLLCVNKNQLYTIHKNGIKYINCLVHHNVPDYIRNINKIMQYNKNNLLSILKLFQNTKYIDIKVKKNKFYICGYINYKYYKSYLIK